MAKKDDQNRERRYREEFATMNSEDRHKEWLRELYPRWHGWNTEFFAGQMKVPHIGFGRTAPRSLGHCAATTDYGAPLQFLLNEALVFGTNLDWVVKPRGEGHRRFVLDLLLRLTVQQYVLEQLQANEDSYRGFGPRFTEHANRIGLEMGIQQVVMRRSASDDECQPVASGWPFCGRDEDYYGDDITEELRRFAIGVAAPRPQALPPSLGAWEMVLFYLATNHTEKLRRMAQGQVDRLKAKTKRARVNAKFERGEEDEDGKPITTETAIDPAWLTWNGGAVRTMVEGIQAFRQYAELPILADALDEAGCTDATILRHLRSSTKGHDCRCWVLKKLLAAIEKPLAD